MAKQSFNVGQVLTPAKLTYLQQTAMLGGAASAKTASYTLVAADAGTTISMTSTSATTVTVNTGLFAAGDTVFIQNLGSGNLTITAGTATVATAGSLILPQNDAGILYFVSTSSSVFYDFIQVGAASPLTTKGDIYGFSTSDARIPIGANATVLTADSTESLGLKWAAPAAGGAYTSLASGSMAAASTGVDLTSISSAYEDLILVASGLSFSGINANVSLRLNNDTGNNYGWNAYFVSNTVTGGNVNTSGEIAVAITTATANTNGQIIIRLPNYADTTSGQIVEASGFVGTIISGSVGFWSTADAVNRITLFAGGTNFDAGTYELFGVK